MTHAAFTTTRPQLKLLLRQASNRILDIVDMQRDFMVPGGALAINPATGSKEDASEIIAPANAFFASLPPGGFDECFVKFDTHFVDEYARSPESHIFPDPHCVYGTPGWQLTVDIAPLLDHTPVYMLAKNEFDMWGSNPTLVARDRIAFHAGEAAAYDNLFHFIPLSPGDRPAERLSASTDAVAREDFIADRVDSQTVVVLCGVASDFCNYQAMLGYLQRGATVIIAEDLTRGIGGPASPAPETGRTADVVAATLAAHPAYAGKLLTTASADIVAALDDLTLAPPRPGRARLAPLAQGDRHAL